ncbi:hypothetical protein K501DRAFT_274637 [Backusella circina FSU 941]|nr:hypothetical protein K501DRAFT_274637 [Backusella circina FSU 941]
MESNSICHQSHKKSTDTESQFDGSIYHEISNADNNHDIIEGDNKSSVSTVTSFGIKSRSTNMPLNIEELNKNSVDEKVDYVNYDSETCTQNSQEEIEYKTYPIAWVLLFFMVILRSAIAIYNNTFSPIPTVTAEYLGISLSKINWLYNAMGLAYVFTSFFTSWLYQRAGIKWSVVLAGVLLTAGCWIRWIAVKINPPSFPIMMIGQTIAAISSPISLNVMTAVNYRIREH